MKNRIVIALGGNALGNDPKEQLNLVKSTAKSIVDLIIDGNEIIISHGNGPQVGMINTGMEFAYNNNAGTPLIPFPECGAMSQGYIGYHLQQAIINELAERNVSKNCVTLITQVEVDANDVAFNQPTKPVGMFYSKEKADEIMKQTGYQLIEDAGRGYRRVVPSPKPISIVEIDSIKRLINDGSVVIAIGGGGVPVIKNNNKYAGVDAVIDKDKSSSRLAIDLDADILLILTTLEHACLDYGKDTCREIGKISTEEALRYIDQKEFAKGSMLPKVEACIDFVNSGRDKTAIITSLSKAKEALLGKTGTIFKNV